MADSDRYYTDRDTADCANCGKPISLSPNYYTPMWEHDKPQGFSSNRTACNLHAWPRDGALRASQGGQ